MLFHKKVLKVLKRHKGYDELAFNQRKTDNEITDNWGRFPKVNHCPVKPLTFYYHEINIKGLNCVWLMLQKTTLKFCSKIKFNNILGQHMMPLITEFLKTSSRGKNQNILDLDSYVGKRNDLFLISILLMCQTSGKQKLLFLFSSHSDGFLYSQSYQQNGRVAKSKLLMLTHLVPVKYLI